MTTTTTPEPVPSIGTDILSILPGRPVPHILGVDPGTHGAIAAVGLDGRALFACGSPTVPGSDKTPDVTAMAGIVRDLITRGAVAMYLEDVPRQIHLPGGGRASATVLRESVARWAGIAAGLSAAGLVLPVELVTPARWQRVMHAGTPGDLPRKARSILAARAIWGTAANLRRTPRSRKDDDGLAEALLLAEFGRRERRA